MKFILQGHDFENEVQTISQVFYPNEKFEKVPKEYIQNARNGEIIVESTLNNNICKNSIYRDKTLIGKNQVVLDTCTLKEQKNQIKLSLFRLFSEITGFKPSWGALTGIRPSKLVLEYYRKGWKKEDIFEELTEIYYVNSEKAILAMEIADISANILKDNKMNGFNLYIGVPFCPSRCLYCSFTSYPIDKYEHFKRPYLECLFKEMKMVENYSRKNILETIYIGGGTPTALDAESLEILLMEINKRFDISKIKEFTLEAGRPDTLSEEKLDIMKKYGVTRISINTQTMNNDTLMKIGRKHSAEMFLSAFKMARVNGMQNINVDLILGLPGESIADVENTFKHICKLEPENVTVHTLAVKSGSILKENLEFYDYNDMMKNIIELEKMIAISKNYLTSKNMKPYYMYRQKNSLGNFENVGYCQDGYECIYNVQIMEEQQTILAIGANGTSKFFFPDTNKLERVFNVKSLEDYINRTDEMLLRKMPFL